MKRIFTCKPTSIDAATSASNDVVDAVKDELEESFEDNLVAKIVSRTGLNRPEELNIWSSDAQDRLDEYGKAKRAYINAVANMISVWAEE